MEKSDKNQEKLLDLNTDRNQTNKPKEVLNKEAIRKLVDDGLVKLTKKQKQYAIKYGIINLAGFEAAKMDLKKNGYNTSLIPHLVQQHTLNDEENNKLQQACLKYKNNQKIKDTKTMKEEEQKKIQIQVNSLFIEQIQETNSPDEQFQEMMLQNNNHAIAFHQFLLDSSKSEENFLLNIVRVMEEEKMEIQQLRIFHGLCNLYKGGKLQIPINLYQPMLGYLGTKTEVLPKHASGFLRLCFTNVVGLDSNCPIPIIDKFDRAFKQQFDYFYQKLQGDEWYSQLVFQNLPHTCMILSIPLIKALTDVSSFHNVDPSHLKDILVISTFAFPTDYKHFSNFLAMLRSTTSANSDRMRHTNFGQFLGTLATAIFQRNPKWFRKFGAVNELMMAVLKAIQENRIDDEGFSSDLCQQLVNGDMTIEELLQLESQISDTEDDHALEQLLNSIKPYNTNSMWNRMELVLNSNCDANELLLIQELGLKLTHIQQLFLKLCTSNNQTFLCTGAGVGKTTFLCGLVIALRQKHKQYIVFLNANANLRYRDCERMEKWIKRKDFKLTVGEYHKGEKLNHITFMAPETLIGLALPEHYHIVFDEAQYLISMQSVHIVQILQNAASFVGVTGSPVTDLHKDILQMLLPESLVAQFPDQYKFNSVEHPANVYKLLTEWYNGLDKLMQEQRSKAPVLLIMNTDFINKCRVKFAKYPWLIFFDKLSPQELQVSLKNQFAVELKDKSYRCFITNLEGGTGIDYPTNDAINTNGGVRLVICVEPESYSELHQYKRRTGRMGKSGIIFYEILNQRQAGDAQYDAVVEALLKTKEKTDLQELKISLRKVLGRMEIDEESEVDIVEKEIKPKTMEFQRQLQKKFKEQLRIQKKKDLKVKVGAIEQIDISQKLNCIDYGGSSDEGDEKGCSKGCGKLEHIGTCFKCQHCDVWSIGAHNCSVKDVGQDNIDQINTSSSNQNNKENDQNQDKNITGKIAVKEDGSNIDQINNHAKDIVLNYQDQQTDIKQILIEGGFNSQDIEMKDEQIEQINTSSEKPTKNQTDVIHSTLNNVDMKEVQIEGGISVKLPRSELKEFQLEIINNQDEKNNKILQQSFTGKRPINEQLHLKPQMKPLPHQDQFQKRMRLQMFTRS